MTELELRKQVVATAKLWLGRKEADGSHKEIIDVYNSICPLPVGYKMKYTDYWCAAFVSAVAQKLGLTGIIFPECGCDRMIALYRKVGRYAALDSGVVIQPGDLVFYDWDRNGTGDHVGLIAEVTASGYRVIEGNKSDAVGYRTVLRNYNLIKGFAMPDYASVCSGADENGEVIVEPAPTTEPEQPATSNDGCFDLRFRILRFGCIGEDVRAMQRNLKSLGFDLGLWGLDGEFGNDTKNAVIAYQRSVGLDQDGEAGPDTMRELNGLSKLSIIK